MQPSASQISIIYITGTAIMVLVFLFIFGFMLLYERKRQRYKATIQQMEIDNQKKLLEAVINAQEKEKQYFAEELHDSIGQLLSAINLNMNTLKRNLMGNPELDEESSRTLEMTHEITKTSIQEVRNISQKLMPVILSDFGILAAITDLLNKINDSGALKATLDYQLDDTRFDATIEKALFRITQELLNNTIKHAGAKHVHISIMMHNEHPMYVYTDDGIGFDLHERTKVGVGLKSIESRVNNINDLLTIESAKKMGIRVSITLPKL